MSELRNGSCCENCKFWDQQAVTLWNFGAESLRAGLCRACPPALPSRRGQAPWPVTLMRDWCGRWSGGQAADAMPSSPDVKGSQS